MTNNKKIGTAFERDVVRIFKNNGYWVHFITPDSRGAQPFDIIAVRDDEAIAVECKTLADSKRYITIDRLEDNQIMAFELWRKCGNTKALVAVKHKGEITFIDYEKLKREGKVLCE